MNKRTSTTRRGCRRFGRAVALGVAISLLPLAGGSSLLAAPSSTVSGLSQGAQGESVRSLQEALVKRGIEVKGGVDGIFGPGTAAAVQQFQAANGLPATAVVDDATALALGLASSPLLGLAPGAQGDAVKALQTRLIAAGYRPAGGADGIFGPATVTALGQFQAAAHLTAKGTVDAATAAALGAVTAAPAPTPEAKPAPAPAAASPYIGLKIGARSDTVKQLQRILINAGFEVVGGADGIFGVLTANALSSFQYSKGIRANAIVDAATAAALEAAGGTTGGSTAAPPPAAASPLAGLAYGSLGSSVKQLQQVLIQAGISLRGGADGVFGFATMAAVKEYQAARGLDRSGKIDQATANALASAPGPSGVVKQASNLLGLRAGSLGGSVKQLQQAMIDLGIKVRGGADGIFGPATANAVREFQRSQGLEATGTVDDRTAAAFANPQAPSSNPTAVAGGFATYGERGNRVMALQGALIKAGVEVRGGVDGMFGAGTSAAVMAFQRASKLPVTGSVDGATAGVLGLAAAPAPPAPDASKIRLEVFPVQGFCQYGDSWGFPRAGGRVHLGVDILAKTGNLLYAVADATVTKIYADYPGSLAGNGLRLTTDDGTYFFYAHMNGIADGIDVGTKVTAGQVVGTVGSTGSSGTPHLHLEIHPKGGAAVNPYPIVKAIDACGVTAPR